MAETMYQNLVVGARAEGAKESVHLVDWPKADVARIDRALGAKMRAVRELVSLGLQVRTQAKLKVRQPLRSAHLIVADPALRDSLAASVAMIKEELNVVDVHFVPEKDVRSYVEYSLKPNFRTLGQRGLGKQAQELKKTMAALAPEEAARLAAALASGSATLGGVELSREDVEIAFSTKEGFAAAGGRVGVVVLETTLDDTLREMGFARELQNRVQNARKEMGLEFTDRVHLSVIGSPRVLAIVEKNKTELAREVLAVDISTTTKPENARVSEVDVEGEAVTLAIARA
jgi:isoleucyl-tRNA synthetase